MLPDFFLTLFGRFLALIVVSTYPQPSHQLVTKLDANRGFGNSQGLSIGIHGDKFYTPYILPHHAGYGVASTAPQTDNLYLDRIGSKGTSCHLLLLFPLLLLRCV